jgi:hypothetical protein
VVAVGAAYTEFEGFKDEATGETVIGLSYASLCQHVKPGGRILMADGSLAIEVRLATSVECMRPATIVACKQRVCRKMRPNEETIGQQLSCLFRHAALQ